MMIQIFGNSLGEAELAAVGRVFASGWLGFGRETQAFQEELGARLGSDRVLCFNSATAAAHVAVRIAGIGAGDEVILPTVNFVGCANAILAAGGVPVFADVDGERFNLLPGEIERLRTPRTKAVLMLHYGGQPADWAPLAAAAHGLRLIEDAACALFARWQGRCCGTLGDCGFYSFDAMKLLVTGDGGALAVNDPALLEAAKEQRYLGLTERQSGIDSLQQGNRHRWWEFDVACAGNRYVPNDITSAIGRVQLTRVDGFIARRRAIWAAYQAGLRGLPGIELPPEPRDGDTASYYLYWLRVPQRRDALAAWLTEHGVYCTFRYYPLHLIPFYGSTARQLPNAETINELALNLPLHQNLTDADVDRVIDTVRAFTQKG